MSATTSMMLLAGPASAEDPSSLPGISVVGKRDGEVGDIDLDTQSTTASRLGLKIRELPGAAYQIDRAAIEAAGARDTQEILRGIPGMTAVQAEGGAAGFVSYRGFSGSQLSQLFNGIAIQYDVVSARPIDSWIVDRVEVIGGPSSFLFGAGAVGGSINYVTKLAERRDFSQGQVRVGSFDTLQTAVGFNRQLTGEGPRGNFLRLDVNALKKDGYVDGNASRSQQAAASLVSDLGERLTHTLAVEWQHEDEVRPYYGSPVLNPTVGTLRYREDTRFRNFDSADGQYEQTIQWARSIVDYRLAESASIRNTVYFHDALRDYRNVEEYAYNAANTLVTRFSPLLQRHKQQLYGERVEATFATTLGGLASDWAFGADYSVNRQTRFPNGPVRDVSTVDPASFTVGNFFDETGIAPGFVPDRDVQVKTIALFAENRTRLLPAVSLVTGVRRDRVDLDLVNRGAITAANPATFTRRYNATTGRVGLVWDVAPGANVYAQYATAADPPAGILTTASFAQARTNSELTTGRQYEVGAKADLFDRRATATIAAYHIDRKNLATIDPTNRLVTLLVGEQSSRGIEVAGTVRLTPELTAYGNFAFVDAQYDNFGQAVGTTVVSRAGNTPPNTPRRVANVGMSSAFAPGWQGRIGARRVSGIQGDVANTQNTPGYTLLDLGLGYRFDRHVDVTARVRNATDRRYVAYISATPLVHLGEPRAADLTVRVRF